MKSIMIAAPSSNTGKTLVTLGIIGALRNRGLDISAFKTGPDFIDTKYLGLASGKPAGNLDIHMQGRNGLKESLSMNMGEFAVIEGAMGYFDGIYNTFENSSYHISRELNIPTILVYRPKGQMFSAVTNIKGMVDFSQSRIKGIILNKTNASIYALLKEKIEEHIDIKVLGYLPEDDSLKVQDRYLGLIDPYEIPKIQEIICYTAEFVEKTIDIDSILNLPADIELKPYRYPSKRNLDVAIAYDQAFNFYYQENLNLLEKTCRVRYFSPLKDSSLPKMDLLYIGGGYPELYREKLSKNKGMLESIRNYGQGGGYVYGEGAGLMYLCHSIEGSPMCGLIEGEAIMTQRLQRFGYVDIELNEECILGEKGNRLKGQEFHRSIIRGKEGDVFNIKKPMSGKGWQCGYAYKNVLASYQHISFLGNPDAFQTLTKTGPIRQLPDVFWSMPE